MSEYDADPIRVIGHLSGYGLRWGNYSLITNPAEGPPFYEAFSPGSFRDSLASTGGKVKMYLDHGRDMVAGSRPLGPMRAFEDNLGLAWEADLLDTSVGRDLLEPMKAGLYSSSIRFSARRELFTARPKRSDYNPTGIPERNIKQAGLYEISAVSAAAHKSASLQVGRSLEPITFTAIEAATIAA